MSPSIGHLRTPGRAALPIVLALVAASVAGPVAAGRPTITRVIDTHFHLEQHFEADPACGPFAIGVTEIADGNSHLVIVDNGSTLKITFGETFRILVGPGRPDHRHEHASRHGFRPLHRTARRRRDRP